MISIYSFVTAVIMYNLALVLVYLLRHKTSFLLRYGTRALLFITLLAVIRLFLPLCWPRAYVITSVTVLPQIETALESQPMEAISGLSVGMLLSALWLLGSCVFAAKYILQVCQATHRRKNYRPSDCALVTQVAKRLGIRYQILISPQVSTPHAAGFFKPVIYLPALDLTEAEWNYILRHEAWHIRSHDIWIKLFYGMIQIVFWWNPVSYLFMHELDTMLELRCDVNLTSPLDEQEKLDYLSAIINVVKQGRPEYSKGPISVSLADSGQDLKQRFEMVLRFSKAANKTSRNALCVFTLILFISSFAVTIQPNCLSARADLSGMQTALPDSAFIVFHVDDEVYWLYSEGTFRGTVRADEIGNAPYNTLPLYYLSTDSGYYYMTNGTPDMDKVQNASSSPSSVIMLK